MILACRQLHKAYGIDVILEKITFHIEEREKAAIVGVNGAGKTTLFKVLTGEISADGGEFYLKKDTSVGYLAQNFEINSDKTIYDEMLSVFDKNMQTEANLREMENEMGGLSGQALAEKMEEYAALQHYFEENDGYSYQSRLKGVLKGLGFTESDFNRPMNQLSGGQKTRVHLGKLLLSKPDVLLLDEPTNHLDIASIEWLEDFLRTYPGSVLIISHDRYFLDRIVTKVIEIENKKSYVYNGNYSFYWQQKEINREIQQKAYE
ncbi:MAG: ABC-F family ATP-binding cassette domain-containing protein, partial [Anaerotignum sp.]|nr:ABC-F family ATP-binding cassette domain-containing protein [Anaerotignum sp.]